MRCANMEFMTDKELLACPQAFHMKRNFARHSYSMCTLYPTCLRTVCPHVLHLDTHTDTQALYTYLIYFNVLFLLDSYVQEQTSCEVFADYQKHPYLIPTSNLVIHYNDD